MRILAYASTASKPTEQAGSDGLAVKVVDIHGEKVVFAAAARGYGDRRTAELVAATAIRVFSESFVAMLPVIAEETTDAAWFRSEIEQIYQILNSRIDRYMMLKCVQLSVDISILMICQDQCYVMSTGGSMICRIGAKSQDVLAYAGNASPNWYTEDVDSNSTYLIISEEVYKMTGSESLRTLFQPDSLADTIGIKMRVTHLINQNDPQLRHGNHSAILIRLMKEDDGYACAGYEGV